MYEYEFKEQKEQEFKCLNSTSLEKKKGVEIERMRKVSGVL